VSARLQDPQPARLTTRETQVLRLVAAGHTDEEIAARLRMGVRTAVTHVRAARWALGARNRAHAVALAYLAGLLEGQP
jgi:DNA-binding CsgD family transcriptional regulator